MIFSPVNRSRCLWPWHIALAGVAGLLGWAWEGMAAEGQDSRDLWRDANMSPKNQGYHYHRNAETFREVGLRLGWAMTELLK